MTYYSGLCIGGPLDGQYHNSNSKQFKAVSETLRPPETLRRLQKAQADAVMTYELSQWRAPKSDQTFDFWLPESLSVAEALFKLQNSYHVTKAQEKRNAAS